jgi:carbamoyl-phosphate synthase large subunit
MKIENKRIFVSGGAGVIGHEIVPRLINRGAIVVVGDLKPRPKSFNSSVIYRQGDLNSLTAQEMAQYAPDAFIHLAATFERSTESYDFWEENFWHNLRLSHHLMSLAKEVKSLKRVIFASSYLIYDPKLYQHERPSDIAVSLKETDPIFPRNLTGVAKLNHEIELRFINEFKSSQFSTVCARIFRGYGRNSRDVISRWIRDLLQANAITVYHPEGLFDYIYAADTAEGLIKLCEYDHVDGIVNLGSGKARRVQDIVDILKKYFPQMKINIQKQDLPYEASEADISLLKRHVGWIPQYKLEDAIPEIIDYERKNLSNPIRKSIPTYNFLISSASRKVPLIRAAQTALRKIHTQGKVIAGDASSNALSRYVADEFWLMPQTRDENVNSIIQGCKERSIKFILPTRDGELLFWSKHAEQFAKENIIVFVSPSDSIAICVDKLKFGEFGEANNLSIIKTSHSIDDILSDYYVVKEQFGSGARSIGLNLTKDQACVHAKKLENPIFQPHVTGVEISADAWLDQAGSVKGMILRRRDIVLSGESQVTTTFKNASIEKVIKNLLSPLKLRGHVVVQAIISSDDKLNIIECNARFGGASTTSIAAGLDSLYWSMIEAFGDDINDYPFHRTPGDLYQVRVPQDLHFNV